MGISGSGGRASGVATCWVDCSSSSISMVVIYGMGGAAAAACDCAEFGAERGLVAAAPPRINTTAS